MQATTTTNAPSIRLLLVGEPCIGKTFFLHQFLQLCKNQNSPSTLNDDDDDVGSGAYTPTIGVKIHSHIYQYFDDNHHQYHQSQLQLQEEQLLLQQQRKSQEYFIDWLDVGAKSMADMPKAHRTFFQTTHVDAVVFMFDSASSASLQFWGEKIEPLLSSAPIKDFHRWQLPVLMIATNGHQQSEQQKSFLSSSSSLSSPSTSTSLIVDDVGSGERGGEGRKLFQKRSFSSILYALFSMLFTLLCKILWMDEYVSSSSSSSSSSVVANSGMVRRLQQNLFADYVELGEQCQVKMTQKRLVDNFLDRVIQKKKEQKP